MSISEKLSNILTKINTPNYGMVKSLVSESWPKLDSYIRLEITRGIYAVCWPEDYSTPDAFRFQLEAILGDANHFEDWFDLSTLKQLDLYIDISHWELSKAGDELESLVYMAMNDLHEDVSLADPNDALPPGESRWEMEGDDEDEADEAIKDFNSWFDRQDPKPGGYIVED